MDQGGDGATGGRPVDVLAREVGLTIRTIRAYQSAGLVPPPERRGKVAVYGEEHAAALRTVKALREQGLGLAAIREALTESRAAPPDAATYARRLLDTLGTEPPVELAADDLRATWGEQLTDDLLARLLATSFFRRVDAATFVSPSRSIVQTGRELARLGVPLVAAVELLEALDAQSRALARRYVDLVLTHLGPGAAAAGAAGAGAGGAGGTEPGGGAEPGAETLWDALARVGPLSTAALASALPVVMREEFDRALGESTGTVAR